LPFSNIFGKEWWTMAGIDDLIQRLPGSRGTKVLIASVTLLGFIGLPVFGITKRKGRQGEDLFSSYRPESIRADQERIRKEARDARIARHQKEEEAKKSS
jgi:hypothetical protein